MPPQATTKIFVLTNFCMPSGVCTSASTIPFFLSGMRHVTLAPVTSVPQEEDIKAGRISFWTQKKRNPFRGTDVGEQSAVTPTLARYDLRRFVPAFDGIGRGLFRGGTCPEKSPPRTRKVCSALS